MKSEKINEIAAALAKAQMEIKGAIRDSKNPFFKSTYADLASVWDACHEYLNKNMIAISQVTSIDEKGDYILHTMLIHSSDQWILSSRPIRVDKTKWKDKNGNIIERDPTPQELGSAETYARRYSLAAIAGVCAIEDDDGNAASKKEIPVAKAEVYYCSRNDAHKTLMFNAIKELIPYDESSKEFYVKVNQELNGEPLASVKEVALQKADKYLISKKGK